MEIEREERRGKEAKSTEGVVGKRGGEYTETKIGDSCSLFDKRNVSYKTFCH